VTSPSASPVSPSFTAAALAAEPRGPRRFFTTGAEAESFALAGAGGVVRVTGAVTGAETLRPVLRFLGPGSPSAAVPGAAGAAETDSETVEISPSPSRAGAAGNFLRLRGVLVAGPGPGVGPGLLRRGSCAEGGAAAEVVAAGGPAGGRGEPEGYGRLGEVADGAPGAGGGGCNPLLCVNGGCWWWW